jgi:predicted GIY-YIG superfamily endonuclease
MTAFLSQNWCGLDWTNWIPLTSDKKALKELPNSSGVYRVRTKGREQLLYIGQTTGLRGRLSTLATHTFADLMPFNDPHTAAQSLWILRMEEKMGFECSASSTSLTEDKRRGLEHMLLWKYHSEKGQSLLCSHGRFHTRYFRSGSRKSGKRGGLLPPGRTNPAGGPSSRPLVLTGQPWAHDWMGLRWSPAINLLRKELASVPTTSGLYKLREASQNRLLYVGETKNLHARLCSHVTAKWSNLNPEASFYALDRNVLDHQRRELETDLLGAYYEMLGEPPCFQYGKS